MLNEVIEGLAIQSDGIYIDGTFGRGGHSKAILEKLGSQGRLLALDKDPEAIAVGQKIVSQDARFFIAHQSFKELKTIAKAKNIIGKVSGILLDLGVSSPQLDDPQRGFSFLRDGPLDMRMDPTQGISAAEWLASAKEAEIADVLYEYGEERFSRRIARAIVQARAINPITTTARLAEIVSAANPRWEKHKHPATRAFQGIRIFINQELAELTSCLEQALDILAISGRLAVMSFHSLEDRLVKNFIRRYSRGDELPAGLPVVIDTLPRLRKLGRAIRAGESEVENNPRSRSCILRIAEKLS